jgi:hypothetical protein
MILQPLFIYCFTSRFSHIQSIFKFLSTHSENNKGGVYHETDSDSDSGPLVKNVIVIHDKWLSSLYLALIQKFTFPTTPDFLWSGVTDQRMTKNWRLVDSMWNAFSEDFSVCRDRLG